MADETIGEIDLIPKIGIAVERIGTDVNVENVTVAETETETTGLLKLTAPLLRRPETVQGTLIQPETGRQPGAVEIEHDHGESESPASGSIPTLLLSAAVP